MKDPKDHLMMARELESLFGRTGFIQVREMEWEPEIRDSLGSPDLVVKLLAGSSPWTLLVEMKRLGEPRSVRVGLAQLDRHLRSYPKGAYGVLMAPFISEESGALCVESGFGFADLSGNACLRFGGVYIEVRTSRHNPHQVKRGPRPLFSAKSERVLKTLMTPPLRPWKVVDLSRAAQVSLGQVSSIRQRLIENDWAEAASDGLLLVSPRSLASAWRGQHKRRALGELSGYTPMSGRALEEAVRSVQMEAGSGAEAVLASFSAAKWIAPYARQGASFFYASEEGSHALSQRLSLEDASMGANVTIWIPQEDDVFTGRIQPVPGVWCTGLIQTWLDLGLAGERGREAADHLLDQKIAPFWGTEHD